MSDEKADELIKVLKDICGWFPILCWVITASSCGVMATGFH